MNLSDLGTSEETYDMSLGTVCLRNKKGKKLHDQFPEFLVKVGPIGVHSPAFGFHTHLTLWHLRDHMAETEAHRAGGPHLQETGPCSWGECRGA